MRMWSLCTILLLFHPVLVDADWSTYGFNQQRTGLNPDEKSLSVDNVENLQRVWTLPLSATTINQAVVALDYEVEYQPSIPIALGTCLIAQDNTAFYRACFFDSVYKTEFDGGVRSLVGTFQAQTSFNSYSILNGSIVNGYIIINCGETAMGTVVESPPGFVTLNFTSTEVCPPIPSMLSTAHPSIQVTATPSGPTGNPTETPSALPTLKPTITAIFSYLSGTCTQAYDSLYYYRICFFDTVYQYPLDQSIDEGGQSTLIGNFYAPISFNTFSIQNGDSTSCGFNRGGEVTLNCGSSVSITITEEVYCTYKFSLTSPQYCISQSPTLSPSTVTPTIKPRTSGPTHSPTRNPSVSPTRGPSTISTVSRVPSTKPTTVASAAPNSGQKICLYGGYCVTNSDCYRGSKCVSYSPYYSQCQPDPTQYLSANCVNDFGSCLTVATCCNPGSFCGPDKTCIYPQAGNPLGLCRNPTSFSAATSSNKTASTIPKPVFAPSSSPLVVASGAKPTISPSSKASVRRSLASSNVPPGYVRRINVAYIGDNAGFFYAIDIYDGTVYWSRHLGMVTVEDCYDLPHFQWGVTSTAVFDRSAGIIYVMGGKGVFFALSMRDGSIAWSLSLVDTAGIDPMLLSVYTALNLYKGIVYFALASHCDFGNYQGLIVAVSTTFQSIANLFYPSIGPMGNYYGGGIWGTGGVAVGTSALFNSIYTATGNTLTEDNDETESANYCNKIVRIRASDLHVLAYDSPPRLYWDDDFGSAPLYFNQVGEVRLGGCHRTLLAVTRKDCRLILVDATTMELLQTIRLSDLEDVLTCLEQAAWDSNSNTLVISSKGYDSSYPFAAGLIGFKLNSTCQLTPAWSNNAVPDCPRETKYEEFPFTNTVIAGPAGKRVAFFGTGPCNTLVAVSISTGAVLWSAALDGKGAVFGTPTVINGTVLVGGWDYGHAGHSMYAFRL